jgi:hypothetical protein
MPKRVKDYPAALFSTANHIVVLNSIRLTHFCFCALARDAVWLEALGRDTFL